MKIFVAVDDSFGMMFNKRRQSKDKNLLDYILQKTNENKLWMNSYTKKIFENTSENVMEDEEFLEKCEKGEFCFVENQKLLPFENKIETIFVCKWNRKYPTDFRFDIELEKSFKLLKTEEIVGNSHEKITIEEWSKK